MQADVPSSSDVTAYRPTFPSVALPPPPVDDDEDDPPPPHFLPSTSLSSSSTDVDVDTDTDAPSMPPPPYGLEPILRVSTVMQSSRYQAPGTLHDSTHRQIAPGMFSYRDHPDERVLPPEWLQFTHPEGKLYFYHPRLRIVTEAWIYHTPTLQKLVTWATLFFQRVQRNNVPLPSTSELCLELEDDGEDCRYYLVDHARRTEFWIDNTTTDELELSAVTSYTHLKLALEHHYWTHVEYFPVHLNLSPDVESELRGVLLHACTDAMTSDLSTSPMTPAKCQTFLQLLQTLNDSPLERGYNNCIVARLWADFARNRFINLHSEPTPRLCRDHMLGEDPERETSVVLRTANSVLFDVPDNHMRCLKQIFVDDITYTEHWQRYLDGCVGEWREGVVGGLGLLITELLLFTSLSRSEHKEWMASVQYALSLIAIILSAVSVLVGSTLLRQHKMVSEIHAAEATNFLFSHQHPLYGLRPLATLYAVPQGFATWSLIAFVSSLLLLSFDVHDLRARIIIWVFAFVVVGSVCLVLGLVGSFRGFREIRRSVVLLQTTGEEGRRRRWGWGIGRRLRFWRWRPRFALGGLFFASRLSIPRLAFWRRRQEDEGGRTLVGSEAVNASASV